MKKHKVPDAIEAVRAMPKYKQRVFGPALPEHRRLGICIICGGNIIEKVEMKCDSIYVNGPVTGDHFRLVEDGYCCKDCGIHYDKLPNEKAIKRIRKKDESILRISHKVKKRFLKELDKIQANLDHNVRMKKI
jgi:hypothetical protein